MKGRLSSTVSLFAVWVWGRRFESATVRKHRLGCLVYSLHKHPHQVGTRTELTFLEECRHIHKLQDICQLILIKKKDICQLTSSPYCIYARFYSFKRNNTTTCLDHFWAKISWIIFWKKEFFSQKSEFEPKQVFMTCLYNTLKLIFQYITWISLY